MFLGTRQGSSTIRGDYGEVSELTGALWLQLRFYRFIFLWVGEGSYAMSC